PPLSLHDTLPISERILVGWKLQPVGDSLDQRLPSVENPVAAAVAELDSLLLRGDLDLVEAVVAGERIAKRERVRGVPQGDFPPNAVLDEAPGEDGIATGGFGRCFHALTCCDVCCRGRRSVAGS